MVRIDKLQRRAYLLDTNVLIHDPASIHKFQEHDLLIPMTVLEELDQLKKGLTDMARSARQATHGLNELLDDIPAAEVAGGVPLPAAGGGRLYFLSGAIGESPAGLSGGCADNRIIAEAMEAQRARPEVAVVVVSKDVNLRVKCAAVGLPVEDYHNDRVVEDIDTMTSGVFEGGEAAWEDFDPDMTSWQSEGRSFYRLSGALVRTWHPGMFICAGGGTGMEAMVREREGETALLEVCQDYRAERHAVWGVRATDARQNFALNLLLHPDTDLVTLAGAAGTGKTFMALAAGLHLIYEARRFERIVITRETVPMGEDIGFLPGTEEEKMAPWMGAYSDNMESLLRTDTGWGNAVTKEMLQGRIQMRSPSFMRGRTFNDTLLIIDEAQNLSPKQIKGLITRAGRNTKIICLGNVAQIDTPYLTATSCGLTALAQRFRDWPHAGHVTLTAVERSRLALRAEAVL
ncbi:PhoH family protein [Ectothiorhodospiraceae bacterium WFHF3C12]|nr:PhoH family protein [Ectothiorhodospiraceae bacterium WFHF3C12]